MPPPDSQTARIVAFPDLKPATRRQLLGAEAGTEFDIGQRMFAGFANGEVLDYLRRVGQQGHGRDAVKGRPVGGH
jgi:hypothetical protein